MRAHIVFANPTHEGSTGRLLDAFVQGLDEAGVEHTLSDLYAMGFNPVLSAAEQAREARFAADEPVPDDVRAEQAKLNAADVWAFVYPVWWTDVPAILKGWFDRVWTVGYAYGPGHPEARADDDDPGPDWPGIRRARRALVLCTAGHSEGQLREWGCYQAMETTMLVDRIFTRARSSQFVMFTGGADLPPEQRQAAREADLARARQLGREAASTEPRPAP